MRNALVSCALFAAAGCGDFARPVQEVQVELSIGSVPPEVSCVRITADGPGRLVEREVMVMPGLPVNESFSGLPLGTVVFSGAAFSGDCRSVTKATVPTWISEESPISVALGRIASVTLTLARNGRARVNVGFTADPTCSAGGRACLADAECCSGACVAGACQAADGGSADASGG